jgi:hypothetical protein
MWVVDNNTPLAVDRGFLRDRRGGEVWIVTIKGTFDVRQNGSLRVSEVQDSPARGAAWAGEPGKSSLLHDTDFILAKAGTDVLVQGHAYAPAGRETKSIEVGLRVGTLVKRIRVHGVRAWMRSALAGNIVPGPARPFEKVALCYENAFGGSDTEGRKGVPLCCARNPVGKGFRHDPSILVHQAAPQLETIDGALRAGPYDAVPAGFGPIAPGWLPRAALAGTYDKAWQENEAPLLPKDFDERFYRSAPQDQQLSGFMPAGHLIELFNMTPEGFWSVRAPDLAFTMRVIFSDGEERSKAVLHTVMLDPDNHHVQFVWHASLPCHGREHRLTRAIINWEGDRTCLLP